MKNSIWHKKATLQVTFHRQGQRQSHSPSHTFTFASRSRFRHKTNNHLILCLKILTSAFSQLKRHIDMCYVYMKVLAFNFLWKSQYSNHQSLQSLHTIFTSEETGNTDATEKIKTQTLRWIVFCVNLTGVRDAQRAGETISGCVCEGVSGEMSAGRNPVPISRLNKKEHPHHAGGCHPICWGSE